MTDSPFDTLTEAFREAKSQMLETARAVKADVVTPADPNAKRLTKQERLMDFQDFLANPARLESEFLRLRDRYNLPPDKPIPVRLIDYIRQGVKEQNQVDKEAS